MTLKQEEKDGKSYDDLIEEVDTLKKELTIYRRRTNRVFDLCPVAMLVIHSETGGIIKMNQQAYRFTGIKEECPTGTLFYQELFINNNILQFPVPYNSTFPVSCEDRLTLGDGTTMHVLRQFVPFESDDIPCVLETISDISTVRTDELDAKESLLIKQFTDSVAEHTKKVGGMADERSNRDASFAEPQHSDPPDDEHSRHALTVLLVEDNPGNQKVLLQMLKKAGVTVDLADDGRKALTKYKQNRYDMLLMDMLMPVLDGYEAISKIRRLESAKPDAPRTPIVAVTASTVGDTQRRCFEAGADDYLTKPVRKNELFPIIEKWTGLSLKTINPKANRKSSQPEVSYTRVPGNSPAIKILVADDSWSMRKILTRLLKESGYHEIRAYANGQDAFEAFNDSGADLIISDWNMPKMDGLEFLKKVRAGNSFSNTPFIMATAEGLKSNMADAKKAGVTDYVTKPFNGDEITTKIKALFQTDKAGFTGL